MAATRKPVSAAAAGLDESGLMHLAGYAATLAVVTLNRSIARVLAGLGLRMVEFSILVLIDTNDEVNQKALGQTLAISPPNLAVVIDRMVERGWVRRERSERDRRAQLIRPTELGRSLCRQALDLSRQCEDEALAPLSEAERAQLVQLMHRVARGARKQKRTPGAGDRPPTAGAVDPDTKARTAAQNQVSKRKP